MTILAKRYLTPFKSILAALTLSFTLSVCAYAKVNVSPLFIQVSDAMEQVKQGELEKTLPILTALQQEFNAFENHDSPMGKEVAATLARSQQQPNLDNLEQLSKALIAFEKEQNPVDYIAKRAQFAKRVMPVYAQLDKAVKAHDLEAVQNEYKRFNTTWSINEMPVRESSLGHYGQIETAMTYLRIAMLSDPVNYAEMEKQSTALGAALEDFKAGNVLQPQPSTAADAPTTLAQGINLLNHAYSAFESNQLDQGKNDLALFIQQWPIFEGEVSTRDGSLYTRVESDLPLIMVKGNDAANMQQFSQLINDLSQISSGNYTYIDAVLILLREGVEALLIIMALLTTLKAANQPRAKRWVYAGAGLGIVASLLGAVALQQFFPMVSASSNREIIEGGVGIIAVAMMLIVGAWLHSKSSITGWKKFMDKQVAQALATGSLLSMMSLSFLSVFREGAETVLFYVGMLPLIELKDLILGIGLAFVALAVIALVMTKSTKRLPIHHLFKVMTLLIYFLAFKILGVSVHALQLTNTLPSTIVEHLPNIPDIGFYATTQGIGAQIVYLILIPVVAKFFKK